MRVHTVVDNEDLGSSEGTPTCDFRHHKACLGSSTDVHMIGAHSSRDEQLELLRSLDAISSDVRWVERGGDEDVRILQVLVQLFAHPMMHKVRLSVSTQVAVSMHMDRHTYKFRSWTGRPT